VHCLAMALASISVNNYDVAPPSPILFLVAVVPFQRRGCLHAALPASLH
jgi:hypothetical protein